MWMRQLLLLLHTQLLLWQVHEMLLWQPQVLPLHEQANEGPQSGATRCGIRVVSSSRMSRPDTSSAAMLNDSISGRPTSSTAISRSLLPARGSTGFGVGD